MARPVPPLVIREQFGFFWRLLPLLAVVVTALLFRVWKVLETDGLRTQVFRTTRACSSLEGELQIEQGFYLSHTAFGRIERAGRALGLVWPEQSPHLIVVDPGLARHDLSLETPLRRQGARR
ncbi:MAG: hypothetical protein Q8O14_11885 [bacterium]|jgi:hypothetical protein|nr:hypothetical protein [bacterium]